MSREREAHAPVISAYRQAARDPIVEHRGQDGREKAEVLTRSYPSANAEFSYLSHAEIAAAVAACAGLEPFDWKWLRAPPLEWLSETTAPPGS